MSFDDRSQKYLEAEYALGQSRSRDVVNTRAPIDPANTLRTGLCCFPTVSLSQLLPCLYVGVDRFRQAELSVHYA